jgi:hypothetical protein
VAGFRLGWVFEHLSASVSAFVLLGNFSFIAKSLKQICMTGCIHGRALISRGLAISFRLCFRV